MDHVKNAFMKDPELKSLVLDDYFSRTLSESQTAWRKTVVLAINHGVPVPIFSAALSYYDGYRCARLPANLLQVFHKTYTLLMVFFSTKHFKFHKRLCAITMELTRSSCWINLEFPFTTTGKLRIKQYSYIYSSEAKTKNGCGIQT